MTYVTGHNTRKIKTFSRARYIELCALARREGYELHKFSIKWDFPCFWRRKFKAHYRKYYIIEDSKIAYFSKKEINRIITGVTI